MRADSGGIVRIEGGGSVPEMTLGCVARTEGGLGRVDAEGARELEGGGGVSLREGGGPPAARVDGGGGVNLREGGGATFGTRVEGGAAVGMREDGGAAVGTREDGGAAVGTRVEGGGPDIMPALPASGAPRIDGGGLDIGPPDAPCCAGARCGAGREGGGGTERGTPGAAYGPACPRLDGGTERDDVDGGARNDGGATDEGTGVSERLIRGALTEGGVPARDEGGGRVLCGDDTSPRRWASRGSALGATALGADRGSALDPPRGLTVSLRCAPIIV
ncbi:hypothetical protein [Sorangium sp. So ce131]|uniref:hypothetical protein n=1 Tax=Sorangium sp. So ce131 TaxID=3133282 RepID=UPI003F61AC1A